MHNPSHTREKDRLKELDSYQVLHTNPEQSFDDLAQIAATVCATPIALISLLDEDKQWFKAKVGISLISTPRTHAFCNYTILGNEPLVIQDLTLDDRFATNPFVLDPPKIRFYAGVPLISPRGFALGTLSVLDVVPRTLSEPQLMTLKMLAQQAMDQIERRMQLEKISQDRSIMQLMSDSLKTVAILGENRSKEVSFYNRQLSEWFYKKSTPPPEYGKTTLEVLEHISRFFKHPKKVTDFFKKPPSTDLPFESGEFETLDDQTLRIEAHPVQEGSRSHGRFWLLRDITRMIESKSIIAQQQMTMTESAKLIALGQMAGGVAHEINNPLAIIQGRAGQIIHWANSGKLTPELASDTASKIVSVVERISKIIKGLRTISTEGSGEKFETTSLNELVQDTLSFCLARIYNQGIKFDLKTPDTNVTVRCRPVQISQVILNLLNNAIDAVSALEEKNIQLSFNVENEKVKIMVEDSGPGIPKNIVEKMFNPFFTTKDPGKGTGLGLSISKMIVNEHHGAFYYDESTPHTRFVIELPSPSPATP